MKYRIFCRVVLCFVEMRFFTPLVFRMTRYSTDCNIVIPSKARNLIYCGYSEECKLGGRATLHLPCRFRMTGCRIMHYPFTNIPPAPKAAGPAWVEITQPAGTHTKSL